MSADPKAVDVPALYPHQKLNHVAMQDPEHVLRWAGTWLGGEAAYHGEMLRAAADIVAMREAAVAELIEASDKFINASFPPEFEGCPDEVRREYRYRHQQLLAALSRIGGGK